MTGRADDTSGYVKVVELPAVAAADTSTVVVPEGIPYDARVLRVDLVPRAAITANGTNFSTLSLQNKGPLGSGSTVVATRTWAAGNSVAGAKEQMTLSGTPANLELKAGDQLQVVHGTGGTGLAMPATSVLVTYLAR
jgi:sensor domain CHASE-containing protein